jgi:DNA helicase-2/ATP-dependent DNA helicase PcrA
LPQYDYVFVDEAQDLNKAQINMSLNSVTAKGRILTVGDTNQAIYGFRGADSAAIPNIISRLNSKILPLSITYRCAKAIVELAQTVVPELEASPTAEDGLVVSCDDTKMLQDVRPGDFILSRTNAPLMGYCLNLLKAGVRANIQGKDLGKNFIYMIKKSEADSVNGFLDWLDNWCGTEVARLTAKNRDSSFITDKRDCFLALCEGTNDLNQVRNNIKALFHEDKDTNDRVILSTTHKAKGLERDRVFMLANTYKKGKSVEESNLYYVAVTRAKKSLYMVAA